MSVTLYMNTTLYMNATLFMNTTLYTETQNSTFVPTILTIQEQMIALFLNEDYLIGLILSIITMSLNALSLIVINHRRKGLSTNMRLLTSLSAADFINGLSIFCHIVHTILRPAMSPNPTSRNPNDALLIACTMAFIFGLYATSILSSLLTLTIMTIDHYLAILKPLHHLTRFSKHNCTLLIIVTWSIAVLCAFSNFAYGLIGFRANNSRRINFCEYIQHTEYQVEYLMWAIAILSMIIILYTYVAICCKVYEINRNNVYIQRGYNRNRKAMMTTLIIVGTFLVCWLPTCIFQIVMIQQIKVNARYIRANLRLFKRVNRYLNYLLLMNSLLDPIVYAIRLREIQQCYRNLFNTCCCGKIANCYRTWINDTSSNLSTEANSYVYYRQRPVDISTHTTATLSESNVQAKLLHKYQAPLRVTFTKMRSPNYDYAIPQDNQTIPCSVKIYSNQTPPNVSDGYLHMKCRQLKHKSEEMVQVQMIPNNKKDKTLLSAILQNNNMAVCKYRRHIANTNKGTTRLELDKIHIYCNVEEISSDLVGEKAAESIL